MFKTKIYTILYSLCPKFLPKSKDIMGVLVLMIL